MVARCVTPDMAINVTPDMAALSLIPNMVARGVGIFFPTGGGSDRIPTFL